MWHCPATCRLRSRPGLSLRFRDRRRPRDFFFSRRRRHTRLQGDWSSDVCSSDLQPIGSGGGIRQLSESTVDFGASDSPMTDAELAKAKGGPVLHIPMVIGAVVVTYNLPDLAQPIKLSPAVLGDVFSGKITKWNDPRIAALNPGVQLPANDVLVVHRSDGSGTTYIFTDYL